MIKWKYIPKSFNRKPNIFEKAIYNLHTFEMCKIAIKTS